MCYMVYICDIYVSHTHVLYATCTCMLHTCTFHVFFIRFIYETERFAGIAELLEILGR